MVNICFDGLGLSDQLRREAVFDGNIFSIPPALSVIGLTKFARAMIEEAFPQTDPREAQFNLDVEQFVGIIGPLKTRFTNHPQTKQLVCDILAEFGCDLELTYFDVPRLRIVTHGGYLTAGVGYAYRPHRDIWYASPTCQVNWWVPIYPLKTEQALAFYPTHWNRPVPNSSREFDYDEWCRVGRQQAVSQIKVDTRKHPLPLEEIPADDAIRLVCDAGTTICFSSAHLHATAPNISGMTRFSFDFRTINLDDIRSARGAHSIDSEARGSTLGDFIRASDFSSLSTETARARQVGK